MPLGCGPSHHKRDPSKHPLWLPRLAGLSTVGTKCQVTPLWLLIFLTWFATNCLYSPCPLILYKATELSSQQCVLLWEAHPVHFWHWPQDSWPCDQRPVPSAGWAVLVWPVLIRLRLGLDWFWTFYRWLHKHRLLLHSHMRLQMNVAQCAVCPPGVPPMTSVLHLNNRWAMEHHQKLMQKCHTLLVTSSILLCLAQLVCVLCKIFECTPVHGSSALLIMSAFLWSSMISWYWLVIFGALSVFNLAYSPAPSIRCTDRRHFVSRSFI